jgi:hypothetical protein
MEIEYVHNPNSHTEIHDHADYVGFPGELKVSYVAPRPLTPEQQAQFQRDKRAALIAQFKNRKYRAEKRREPIDRSPKQE